MPPGLVSVLCSGNRHTRCSCSCSKAVCLAVGQRVVIVVVVAAVCNTRCCCCRRLCRCRGGQCVVLVGLLHGVDIAHRTLEIGCKAMQGVNKVESERDRERALLTWSIGQIARGTQRVEHGGTTRTCWRLQWAAILTLQHEAHETLRLREAGHSSVVMCLSHVVAVNLPWDTMKCY